MAKKKSKKSSFFDALSNRITRVAGSPAASIVSILIIVVWAVSGPIFHFSDTWQLVINTGTTIITFLMVFIIQQTQNKDTTALHLKLNELIACNEHASNRLIDIEDLTDQELQTLKKFYIKLATLAENERDLYTTHSLDDATMIHDEKMGAGKIRKQHASKKSSPSK